MRSARLILAVVVALVAGCTSQSICQKEFECHGNDRDYDDDFVQVCSVTYDGQIRELQANKESDCQNYAATKLALDGCRAGLKCDDYSESDLGGECDDQLDDFIEAAGDVDFLECSSAD